MLGLVPSIPAIEVSAKPAASFCTNAVSRRTPADNGIIIFRIASIIYERTYRG
jgi:hypothetical protein